MFDCGIFTAVWKGRGGGQEFSAEVIRVPGWVPGIAMFDQSFCFKRVSLLCSNRSIFPQV